MQILTCTYDNLYDSKKDLPFIQNHTYFFFRKLSFKKDEKYKYICTCQYYDDAGNDVDRFLVNSMLPEELLRNLRGCA